MNSTSKTLLFLASASLISVAFLPPAHADWPLWKGEQIKNLFWQKKALQIKDRKTPPRTRPQTLAKKPTTTGVIKKKEKPKTKVATIVKPVIAKSIHHIQPGKPDENGVRRLFKFADLVQNEHF